jgi:hypothetical protein
VGSERWKLKAEYLGAYVPLWANREANQSEWHVRMGTQMAQPDAMDKPGVVSFNRGGMTNCQTHQTLP